MYYDYTMQVNEEGGAVWLSCLEVPEMFASGDTLAEAQADAVDALETALSIYVEQRRAIPLAQSGGDPRLAIRLPALSVAKILLWNTMLAEGVTRAELASRLGCTRQMVDRLVDFLHASKIERVEHALMKLGRRITLGLESAA